MGPVRVDARLMVIDCCRCEGLQEAPKKESLMARLRARRSPGGDTGFTLIELLIVIVIIGILAGIATFAVSAFRNEAAGAGYDEDRRSLETAIAGYYARHSAYPPNLTALVSDGLLDNVQLSDSTHLVGTGYTIEFTPGSPPTLSDRPTSLAAGGTPVTPTGAASPSPSPSTSPSASPSPVATTMTSVATAGTATSTGSGSGLTWSVTVTVTVTDNLGAPVSGAAVSATWGFTYGNSPNNRGIGTQSSTCPTDGSGTCTFTSSTMQSNVASATLTVSSVSKTGLTWNSAGSQNAPPANRP